METLSIKNLLPSYLQDRTLYAKLVSILQTFVDESYQPQMRQMLHLYDPNSPDYDPELVLQMIDGERYREGLLDSINLKKITYMLPRIYHMKGTIPGIKFLLSTLGLDINIYNWWEVLRSYEGNKDLYYEWQQYYPDISIDEVQGCSVYATALIDSDKNPILQSGDDELLLQVNHLISSFLWVCAVLDFINFIAQIPSTKIEVKDRLGNYKEWVKLIQLPWIKDEVGTIEEIDLNEEGFPACLTWVPPDQYMIRYNMMHRYQDRISFSTHFSRNYRIHYGDPKKLARFARGECSPYTDFVNTTDYVSLSDSLDPQSAIVGIIDNFIWMETLAKTETKISVEEEVSLSTKAESRLRYNAFADYDGKYNYDAPFIGSIQDLLSYKITEVVTEYNLSIFISNPEVEVGQRGQVVPTWNPEPEVMEGKLSSGFSFLSVNNDELTYRGESEGSTDVIFTDSYGKEAKAAVNVIPATTMLILEVDGDTDDHIVPPDMIIDGTINFNIGTKFRIISNNGRPFDPYDADTDNPAVSLSNISDTDIWKLNRLTSLPNITYNLNAQGVRVNKQFQSEWDLNVWHIRTTPNRFGVIGKKNYVAASIEGKTNIKPKIVSVEPVAGLDITVKNDLLEIIPAAKGVYKIRYQVYVPYFIGAENGFVEGTEFTLEIVESAYLIDVNVSPSLGFQGSVLTAKATVSDGRWSTKVPKGTWYIDAPQYATINESGIITIDESVDASVVVQYVTEDGGVGSGVFNITTKTSGIYLEPVNPSVLIGSLIQFYAYHYPDFVQVEPVWKTNTPNLEHKGNGLFLVKGGKGGDRLKVEATYNGDTASTDVIVSIPASAIKLEVGSVIRPNEVLPYTVTLVPANAEEGYYVRVDDPSIIQIQGNKIIGGNTGTTTMYALTYSGLVDAKEIRCEIAPTGISISEDDLPIIHYRDYEYNDPRILQVEPSTASSTKVVSDTANLVVVQNGSLPQYKIKVPKGVTTTTGSVSVANWSEIKRTISVLSYDVNPSMPSNALLGANILIDVVASTPPGSTFDYDLTVSSGNAVITKVSDNKFNLKATSTSDVRFEIKHSCYNAASRANSLIDSYSLPVEVKYTLEVVGNTSVRAGQQTPLTVKAVGSFDGSIEGSWSIANPSICKIDNNILYGLTNGTTDATFTDQYGTTVAITIGVFDYTLNVSSTITAEGSGASLAYVQKLTVSAKVNNVDLEFPYQVKYTNIQGASVTKTITKAEEQTWKDTKLISEGYIDSITQSFTSIKDDSELVTTTVTSNVSPIEIVTSMKQVGEDRIPAVIYTNTEKTIVEVEVVSTANGKPQVGLLNVADTRENDIIAAYTVHTTGTKVMWLCSETGLPDFGEDMPPADYDFPDPKREDCIGLPLGVQMGEFRSGDNQILNPDYTSPFSFELRKVPDVKPILKISESQEAASDADKRKINVAASVTANQNKLYDANLKIEYQFEGKWTLMFEGKFNGDIETSLIKHVKDYDLTPGDYIFKETVTVAKTDFVTEEEFVVRPIEEPYVIKVDTGTISEIPIVGKSIVVEIVGGNKQEIFDGSKGIVNITNLIQGLTGEIELNIYGNTLSKWAKGITEIVSLPDTITSILYQGVTDTFKISSPPPDKITSLVAVFSKSDMRKVKGVKTLLTDNITDLTRAFEYTVGLDEDGNTSWELDFRLPNLLVVDQCFKGSEINQELYYGMFNKVDTFYEMFCDTPYFNKPCNFPNSASSFEGMFDGAQSFNSQPPPLSMNTYSISRMFKNAVKYNYSVTNLWSAYAHLVRDMSWAFAGALSFNANLNFWGYTAPGNKMQVITIRGIFANAGSITSTFIDWEAPNLEDTSYAFQNCLITSGHVITALTSSNNVTNMSHMYEGTRLSGARPPAVWRYVTTKVKDMSYLFARANWMDNSSTRIDISWSTDEVENFSWMFAETAYPFELSLKTQSATNMDGMFYKTTKFTRNISSWCVEKIPSKPKDFDTDANPNWLEAYKPVWGECLEAWDMAYEVKPKTVSGLPKFYVESSKMLVDAEFFTKNSKIPITEHEGIKYLTFDTNAPSVVKADVTSEYIHRWFPELLRTLRINRCTKVDWSNASKTQEIDPAFVPVMPPSLTNLDRAFAGSKLTRIPGLKDLDLKYITSIEGIFENSDYNSDDIYKWSLPKLISAKRAFYGTNEFNQPLDWAVPLLEDVSYIFSNSKKHNNITKFATTKLTSAESCYEGAQLFNSEVPWTLTSVTSVSRFFKNAPRFNKAIAFNLSKAVTADEMFSGATAFNQTLNGISAYYVISARYFLKDAVNFNNELGNWLARVEDVTGAFQGCKKFNKSFKSWTGKRSVKYASHFLDGAIAYDQPLTNMDFLNLEDASYFLANTNYNQPIQWEGVKYKDLSYFLYNNPVFNNTLEIYTPYVTNFEGMFKNAIAYNTENHILDTFSAVNMNSMYEGAKSFRQSLRHYYTANVTTATSMLKDVGEYDHDLSNWIVGNLNRPENFTTGTTFKGKEPRWGIKISPYVGDLQYQCKVTGINSNVTPVPDKYHSILAPVKDAKYDALYIADKCFLPVGKSAGYKGMDEYSYSINTRYLAAYNRAKVSYDLINKNFKYWRLIDDIYTMPEGVESLNFSNITSSPFIEDGVDRNYVNLHFQVPKSVTSLESAFHNIQGKVIGIDKWDVSRVINFRRCFSRIDHNVNNLLPPLAGWQPRSAEDMEAMFIGNLGFIEDISMWETPLIESMPKDFDKSTSQEWTRVMKPWQLPLTMNYKFDPMNVDESLSTVGYYGWMIASNYTIPKLAPNLTGVSSDISSRGVLAPEKIKQFYVGSFYKTLKQNHKDAAGYLVLQTVDNTTNKPHPLVNSKIFITVPVTIGSRVGGTRKYQLTYKGSDVGHTVNGYLLDMINGNPDRQYAIDMVKPEGTLLIEDFIAGSQSTRGFLLLTRLSNNTNEGSTVWYVAANKELPEIPSAEKGGEVLTKPKVANNFPDTWVGGGRVAGISLLCKYLSGNSVSNRIHGITVLTIPEAQAKYGKKIPGVDSIKVFLYDNREEISNPSRKFVSHILPWVTVDESTGAGYYQIVATDGATLGSIGDYVTVNAYIEYLINPNS